MSFLYPLFLTPCFLLLPFVALQAQEHAACGVSALDNQLIKERMMRQRHSVPVPAAHQRAISYIPVSFHLVGQDNGTNYPTETGVLQALCRLNDSYADQNIQFYIHNQLRYLPNSAIYDDAYSWDADDEMQQAKINNTLNIFVGANVSEPVAGFYSPWGDYVWVKRGDMSYGSTTLVHEVGHFFTLPHTFSGWEGENCEQSFGGGNVPTFVNGHPVEYAARVGGNANCLSGGDGFCDTEADYYAYRLACPVTPSVKDPGGASINPDETLFMSYLSDACMNRFSAEQQAAMFTDITQRGWANDPLPAGLSPIPDTIQWACTPAANTVVPLSGNIELTWNTVAGATRYYVELYRTFNNANIETVLQTAVVGDTTLSVPAAGLQINRIYRWRVVAYNPYWTCTPISQYFNFITGVVSSDLATLSQPNQWALSVHPQPINQIGHILVHSPAATTANLRLYDISGRLQYHWNTIELTPGDNRLEWTTAGLAAGVYLLEMQTPQFLTQQKIVINR